MGYNDPMNELKYLNKYFLKYRYRIILGILITIGSKIFALFTPNLLENPLP